MAEQVIVTIKGGRIMVEADGVAGKGCEALTRPIEDLYACKTGGTKKPEYHRTERVRENETQGN